MVTPHGTYLQNSLQYRDQSLQCRDLSLQSPAVVVGSDMQPPLRALGKREKAYDSKCSYLDCRQQNEESGL
jgi:hypothetical protein